jgi:hypothetical protein
MTKMMEDKSASLLKGKVAESIVRYMLEASGKKVYFSGVENHTHIMEDMIGSEITYSNSLSDFFSVPDFIVEHQCGIREFVEVKYRHDGQLTQNDLAKLERLSETWKPIIIILSMPDSQLESNIRIIESPYFAMPEKTHINVFDIKQYLRWRLNPDVIEQSIRMTRAFFAEFTPKWSVQISQQIWIL